jgi:hypothetical protein
MNLKNEQSNFEGVGIRDPELSINFNIKIRKKQKRKTTYKKKIY